MLKKRQKRPFRKKVFLALQRVGALIAQPFVLTVDVQEPDGPTWMHQFLVSHRSPYLSLLKPKVVQLKGLDVYFHFIPFVYALTSNQLGQPALMNKCHQNRTQDVTIMS